MNERYVVKGTRISRKTGGVRAEYREGDIVTGDQLRALGCDIERLLTMCAIAVCEDKAKAAKPEPEPVPAEPEAAPVGAAVAETTASKPAGFGRKLVSDG